MKKGTANPISRQSFVTFMGEPVVTTESTIVVNIEIRKHFERAIQEGPATNHVGEMIKAVTTAKWTLELATKSEESTEWYQEHGKYPTSVSIFFRLIGKNSSNADIEKNDRLVALADAAQGTKNQRRNWTIYAVDGEKWEPMSPAEKVKLAAQRGGKATVSYADVSMPNQEMIDYVFEDIYGCGPQLRMVVSKLCEPIENGFAVRSHALLIGKPGAAKSYTLQCAAKLFPNDGAIMWIDGTAMTSAGIIDALKDAETMPRYIFVEEIDKADSAA